LHAAVNAARRLGLDADITFGLVPLGTGNDLARTVDISFDPAKAAKTVVAGRARGLDLLVSDDGLAAVNAVHLGIGAEAVRHGGAAKRLLGAPGFAVGALVAGVRERGWRVSIDVDGKALANDNLLMVGLAVGQSIGGGTPLAPHASPADGLCDVIVATGTGALQRTAFAWRLRRGTHLPRPDVEAARGVTVTVHGDPIRANVDGEVLDPRRRWNWALQRQAWRLIVP
jgi:diacylglycerol kinase family enzyme